MTGSISIVGDEPIWVEDGDSIAIVYGCDDTPAVRDAARGMIGAALASTDRSAPVVVFIDQRVAMVYVLDRRRFR